MFGTRLGARVDGMNRTGPLAFYPDTYGLFGL